MRHALESVGVDALPAEDLTWCIGPPLKESVESLLGGGAAVMVGDRGHDMLGAAANGMLSAGVLYGYGPREELEASGAQLLLDSPSEFGRILEASWRAAPDPSEARTAP